MNTESLFYLLRTLKHEVSKPGISQQTKTLEGDCSTGGIYRAHIDRKIWIHFTTLTLKRGSGYHLTIDPAPGTTDNLFVNADMIDPLLMIIGRTTGPNEIKFQSDILEAINTLVMIECMKSGLDQNLGLSGVFSYAPNCWSNTYKINLTTKFGNIQILFEAPCQSPPLPFIDLHPDNPTRSLFREKKKELATKDYPDPITAMNQCALLAKIGITQIISNDELHRLNTIADKAA